MSATIAENVAQVRDRIAAACRRVGRAPEEVTLVAVTKTRPVEEVAAAHAAGVRHIGENRIEEAAAKRPKVARLLGSESLTWHMIGHIQSRKARDAVALADVIHSVDSLRLAQRLDRFAAEGSRRLPVLIEVNVSGEEAKFGFVGCREAAAETLASELGELEALEHLEVRGLMTMAPIVAHPEEARPVFQRLRQLRDALRARLPFASWVALSMGMTDDYSVAVEEGATLVRIGRAIFGPLSPQEKEGC